MKLITVHIIPVYAFFSWPYLSSMTLIANTCTKIMHTPTTPSEKPTSVLDQPNFSIVNYAHTAGSAWCPSR